MKITKKITSVEEVELSLPAYFKKEFTYYKITSENTGLDISVWGENAVMIKKLRYEYEVQEAICYTPTTEQEFNEALNVALALTATIAESAIEPTLQAEHSYLITNNQEF